MLSSLEKGIITLVKNALKGEKQTLPEDFDFVEAYKIAKKHQIIPIIYYGGAHIDSFVSSAIGTKFLVNTMALAAYSENQLNEIDTLSKAFKENGIEFLKLKGTVLKRLYPHPEMRLMSDADVLVKKEQYAQIEKIVQGLGFSYKQSSDHEWIWEKPELTLELHKRLVATYQKDYYAYFGDGWQLAKKENDSTEYKMSREDELVYLFTHLAKHYRDSGIGVKHFTDIYVFMNAERDLDMSYIERALDNLGLLSFFKNVRKMLLCWFEDEPWDEVSEFITAKVFESGVYGQRITELKSQALKNKIQGKKRGKLGRFFVRIFPPYKTMTYIFPVLEKVPILLPFMWVWRLIKLVFTGKDRLKKYNEESKIQITDDTINEYQCELNYVGLDYNFKE